MLSILNYPSIPIFAQSYIITTQVSHFQSLTMWRCVIKMPHLYLIIFQHLSPKPSPTMHKSWNMSIQINFSQRAFKTNEPVPYYSPAIYQFHVAQWKRLTVREPSLGVRFSSTWHMTLVDAEMHGKVLGTPRQYVGGIMHLVTLQIRGGFFYKKKKNVREKVMRESVHLQG